MINSEEQNFVEPRFKYTRFVNYVAEIISKDTISCIAVHSKFIVIGTDWGNIHILDHLGNKTSKKEIHAHSTTINQISIDDTGEYIASCSNDGKVMIFGLLDDKQYPVLTFNQAIHAIAISPDFKRTNQFITGDTRLLLVSKGILSPQKHKVLQENKSVIRNIKWNTDIVVYATNDSAFVFDMVSQVLIGIIDPNKSNTAFNQEDFYCRISWFDNKTFIIGWGHLAQICIIKEKYNPQMLMKQLEFSTLRKENVSNKKVESIYSFHIQDRVLGLVPYDKYLLAVVDPSEDDKPKEDVNENNLMVLVIEPSATSQVEFTEVATDQISPKGFSATKRYKIHLERIPFENQFYIVSSKDVISVKEFEIDDRIKWLIHHENFEKALEIVSKTSSYKTKYNKKEIGTKYVEYLITKKEYSKAANICATILDNKESWEEIVKMFLDINFIKVLVPYLPCNGIIILERETYTHVLKTCFANDLETFLTLLGKWSSNLYDIREVITMVLEETEKTKKQTGETKPSEPLIWNLESVNKSMSKRIKIIIECLGILYENNREYDKSLECYLQLKSNYIFQLIPRRNMFDIVNSDRLLYIMTMDKDKTLKLLMDFMHDVTPENVVRILSPTPILLFHYLDALFKHNKMASEPYHSQMVMLYAVFNKENMMSFLKSSDKYDLNAAIKFCQTQEFNKAVIYLLGRVGRSNEALQIIMSEEGAECEAIEYCRECGDDDLWKQLMKYSIDKPNYIKAILENSSMDVDVKSFIRRIRNDTEIPGLKDSLVKLLINFEKENNLKSSHQQAKWNDIFDMIHLRFHYTTMPIICDLSEKSKCVVCFKSIVNSMTAVVLFRCSHLCHKACLKEPTDDTKISCSFCIGI